MGQTAAKLKDCPRVNGRFTPGNAPKNPDKRKTPYQEAVALQQLVLSKAKEPKMAGIPLASLCRAWCDLEERKRILRNKPLPGQLRPDRDPGQLLKELKKARVKQILDVQNFAAPIEDDDEEVKETKEAELIESPKNICAREAEGPKPDAGS
jgi:hypothetical protein